MGQAAHDSERAAASPIGITGIRWAIWQGRDVLNIYYRFLPEVWGRGYATEATRAAIDVWRAHLSGHLVMAYTIPANTGSQRTALAAGLKRREDLDADDQFGPTVVFALER